MAASISSRLISSDALNIDLISEGFVDDDNVDVVDVDWVAAAGIEYEDEDEVAVGNIVVGGLDFGLDRVGSEPDAHEISNWVIKGRTDFIAAY